MLLAFCISGQRGGKRPHFFTEHQLLLTLTNRQKCPNLGIKNHNMLEVGVSFYLWSFCVNQIILHDVFSSIFLE